MECTEKVYRLNITRFIPNRRKRDFFHAAAVVVHKPSCTSKDRIMHATRRIGCRLAQSLGGRSAGTAVSAGAARAVRPMSATATDVLYTETHLEMQASLRKLIDQCVHCCCASCADSMSKATVTWLIQTCVCVCMYVCMYVCVASREINPYVDQWEEDGIFPAHQVFKKLGDAGFLGVTKPVEYGGLGLDYSYSVAIAEVGTCMLWLCLFCCGCGTRAWPALCASHPDPLSSPLYLLCLVCRSWAAFVVAACPWRLVSRQTWQPLHWRALAATT